MTTIFQHIDNGEVTGVTSVITLTEVLVHPLLQRNYHLAQMYRDLLLNANHLRMLAIDARLAEHAADLRARYRLRTPDALQIAAALASGCQAFLTNDSGLRRVTELPVLVLDELEL